MLYTEDSSKNHPAGLKGRNSKCKVVKHHNNVENALFVCFKNTKDYVHLIQREILSILGH